MEIEVPRDRDNEFEPIVVTKNQKNVSGIEDKILRMEASPGLISNITDKILPIAKEWQNRPLESLYAHVIMDAVHYKVRQDGEIFNKAANVAIGTNIEGMKDVLGIWVGENESSKFLL